MQKHEQLLTAKELAEALRRHPTYVYAMRKAGFPMPGFRATLSSAIAWVTDHPQPRKSTRAHTRAN
jgi:hypothetical protein